MPYPGQGPQYRDRWLATLQFSHTDRVPLEPGNGRESTLKRWHAEGLPAGIAKGEEVSAVAYHQAGGREELPIPGDGFPVDFTCIPRFKEKIIEHRGATQIVQDWKGNVCEIGVEYETRHLRAGVDFVTRRWIRCPVESRSDWPSVARRYDARDSTRLPPDGESRAQRLHHRSWPVAISVPGPFWQLREWLGFEALCTLMYDDPQFLNEMLAFWSDFVFHMLQRTFSSFVPDEVHVSEDMAFKGFSMISPRMTCDFLLPIWSRWGNLVSCAGCPIYAIDSDGYVGELLPLWIEAGFNVCDPMEVAAGNDMAEMRRLYGKQMAFRGGVDKRAIAKGGLAIVAEIDRIRPVILSGGYIPGCDHGVPPDVSWSNFVRYVELLARATGWLDG